MSTVMMLLGILGVMSTLISIVLGWLWKSLKSDINGIKDQKYVTQENMDKRLEAMEKQFITEFKAANRELALIVDNINQKIDSNHSSLLLEIKSLLSNKKNFP